MPIVFEKQKKTQRNLIFILLGVFLIIIIVLWQGFFKKEEEEILPVSIIFPKKEVKINFEILKNPLLEKLQPFSEITPFEEIIPPKGKPEKVGRENPFIPY